MAIKRAVVLGEPGAGKTTTLWKLARNLVDTAIDNPQAPIPLVVRLGKWTDEKQSLPDFIATQLGGLGVHLATLLSERAVLLLDGLNEIPVAQRKTKDGQVQQFIENHSDLMAVVTCREQDYTLDLGFDRIEIAPLNPLQIRKFVERYLGETEGDVLFWKLAGEEAKDYERRYLDEFESKYDFAKEIFWGAPYPTRQDGDFVIVEKWGSRNYIWNRWLTLRDHPSSLMVLAKNPYMLFMLTDVYTATGDLPDNRGELFRDFVETLFVREGIPIRDKTTRRVILTDEARTLFEALRELALEMQIQRRKNQDETAVTVLPLVDVQKFLNNERLEYLAASTSIISLGAEVRFTHQLLQEYFAAVGLQYRIFERDVSMQAQVIWHPDNWWERTNWEEAVILLAGLYSDDCTRVLEWVESANPEVAAQCINKSGAFTPDATLIRFRDKWIPRLTDLKNDPSPHARAAVGRALGQLMFNGKPLDNRKGVSVTDANIPDIDWVEIAGGDFIYQDDKKRTLPTFHMSRYPVTYAQYQAFVDAPDGFQNDRWWQGLPEEGKAYGTTYRTRELSEQYFKFWNHPRETVSWWQMVAFCRWLSAKVGYEVRLPTEFEWERAARGENGLIYPYGNEFDGSKGNTSERPRIGQTNAVGIYPQGAAPDGVLDMSGNVFEWCATDYSNPQEHYEDEDLSVDSSRVLRGGSWGNNNVGARAAFRDSYDPSFRVSDYGFRVVVRFPLS